MSKSTHLSTPHPAKREPESIDHLTGPGDVALRQSRAKHWEKNNMMNLIGMTGGPDELESLLAEGSGDRPTLTGEDLLVTDRGHGVWRPTG